MTDFNIGQEQIDEAGSSAHFNGTVGTSNVSIPTVAGKVISEFLIENLSSNPKTTLLYVSLDAGTTFKRVAWGSSLAWSMKGNKKQLVIKADAVGRAYEMLVNFEAYP